MANKAKITKSIFRKLSTAPYETVDVNVSIEEEIEWTTQEKKQKEIDKVTKLLILDFLRTHDQVMKELKVERCLAKVTTDNPPGKKNKQQPNKEKAKPDKKTDVLSFLD